MTILPYTIGERPADKCPRCHMFYLKDEGHACPVPVPEDRREEGGRCEHTGNLCGTDTWPVGEPCDCAPCHRYLASLPVAEDEQPAPPSGDEGEDVDEIAARICVYAYSLDGVASLSERDREIVRDIARWVVRDRASAAARLSAAQLDDVVTLAGTMSPGQLYQVLTAVRRRYYTLAQAQEDLNSCVEMRTAAEAVSRACGATDRFLYRERGGEVL